MIKWYYQLLHTHVKLKSNENDRNYLDLSADPMCVTPVDTGEKTTVSTELTQELFEKVCIYFKEKLYRRKGNRIYKPVWSSSGYLTRFYEDYVGLKETVWKVAAEPGNLLYLSLFDIYLN